MALTFTLAPSDGAGTTISYGELTLGNYVSGIGRYAVSVDPATPRMQHMRFRPPGVDGSLIIRCGKIARIIHMGVRYVGNTLAAAEAAYVGDMALLSAEAYNVTAAGQSYNKCNLLTESVSRATAIRNTGREYSGAFTQVYFDVSFTMSQDDFS